MIEIIYYDIKRLVFTKAYASLLAITLIFSYYILSNYTIIGTDYTAPFSEWSYSSFLCSIQPFLVVSILLLCTYVFSVKEKGVRTLSMTTPLTVTNYYLSKAAEIMLVYIATSLMVILLSFIFYAKVFSFYEFHDFIKPIMLFIIPPAIFFTGLGFFAGIINRGLLFAIMILSFFIGNLGGILGYYGLFSKAFTESYPHNLTADTKGEVPYILPDGFITSRVIWLVLGILLFLLVCFISNKKLQKN